MASSRELQSTCPRLNGHVYFHLWLIKGFAGGSDSKESACNAEDPDSILITVILIFLFLLFAPCICNCVTGFASSHMKAFKLQMVAQTPATAAASSSYYLGPLDQKSSV